MLVLFCRDGHITVETDACDRQLGAALLQAQQDGTKKANRLLLMIARSGRKKQRHYRTRVPCGCAEMPTTSSVQRAPTLHGTHGSGGVKVDRYVQKKRCTTNVLFSVQIPARFRFTMWYKTRS